MPKPVKIINPLPGGQSYTSEKRARNFCRRGIAFMVGDRLQFVERVRVDRADKEWMKEEIEKNRGGVVYWNGTSKDPCAMKKPGEIRS